MDSGSFIDYKLSWKLKLKIKYCVHYISHDFHTCSCQKVCHADIVLILLFNAIIFGLDFFKKYTTVFILCGRPELNINNLKLKKKARLGGLIVLSFAIS